ncbi:MAG TPA: glycosyltransferase [Opitutaceae bacterium]
MKILAIAPSLEGRHGWPGRTAKPLAIAQAEAGHTLTLLHTGHAASEVSEHGVQLRQFKRHRPESLCRAPDLARFLATSAASCDVVHHYGIGLRTLHDAAAKCRRDRVPLIVSPRGTFAGWRRSRSRRLMASLFVHPGALARVSGWHALSTAEAEDIKALGFTQPILVAPDGIASPTAVSLLGAREHWHKLCPACAGRPTALFHGALHSRKRILELIDLWLEVSPPDWLLLIAGTNDQYNRTELRDYVSRVLGQGRIAIEASEGHPPPYAAANLFLMPAVSESLARSTGQALAAGVPALVTDTSPWTGFETAGAGWRVAWEQFAPTLKSALTEGLAGLEARGQAARAWITEHHSWKRSAESLTAFYTQFGGRKS